MEAGSQFNASEVATADGAEFGDEGRGERGISVIPGLFKQGTVLFFWHTIPNIGGVSINVTD